MIQKTNNWLLVAGMCFTACGLPDNREASEGVSFDDNGRKDEKSSAGGEGGSESSALGGNGGQNSVDEEEPEDVFSPRGYLVVSSDYESASVSLLDLEGNVLSETFLSSASAPTGLSSALSGDLVAPTTVLRGDELVVIDRFPAAVLTWVDLKTAEVRTQLSVATGFSSNPHDYIPVSATKAYVTRFGGNENEGQEPHDSGNDVLIIDPSVPEITGSIDLEGVLQGEDTDIMPRADRATMAAGFLRVLGVSLSADYQNRASSRLISIDPTTDKIVDVEVIDGMTSCNNLALSPDGDQLAVACNGAYGQSPDNEFPDSGILLFQLAEEPREVERFAARDLGGEQIGGIDYADDQHLVYTTLGRYNEDRSKMAAPDTARILDLSSGTGSKALVSTREKPFSLGDFRCVPSAGSCLLTDAETSGGVVHLFKLSDSGDFDEIKTIEVDGKFGLPPRYLGEF